MADMVNHPPHYTSHPSGVECIQVTEWMGFNLGNALKYIWRADLKGNVIEDLKKARFYVDREIARREKPDEPQVLQQYPEAFELSNLNDADKGYVWNSKYLRWRWASPGWQYSAQSNPLTGGWARGRPEYATGPFTRTGMRVEDTY